MVLVSVMFDVDAVVARVSSSDVKTKREENIFLADD